MGKKIVISLVVFSFIFAVILFAMLKKHPELTSMVGQKLTEQFQNWYVTDKKTENIVLGEFEETLVITPAQLPEELTSDLPPHTKALRLQIKFSYGITTQMLLPFEIQDQNVLVQSQPLKILKKTVNWSQSAIEPSKDPSFPIPTTLQAKSLGFIEEFTEAISNENRSKIEPLAKEALESLIKNWLIESFPKDKAKIGSVTVQFRKE